MWHVEKKVVVNSDLPISIGMITQNFWWWPKIFNSKHYATNRKDLFEFWSREFLSFSWCCAVHGHPLVARDADDVHDKNSWAADEKLMRCVFLGVADLEICSGPGKNPAWSRSILLVKVQCLGCLGFPKISWKTVPLHCPHLGGWNKRVRKTKRDRYQWDEPGFPVVARSHDSRST